VALRGDEFTTMVRGDLLRQIVLHIPCAHCKADVGEPCTTKEGDELPDIPVEIHVSRIAPVWAIYKVGYHKGRRDMKEKMSGSPGKAV
jgi:hypothetical protein